jgi:hypothetical protein
LGNWSFSGMPVDHENRGRLLDGLANLGLGVDENICSRMVAYLGAAKFEYRYCEVREVSNYNLVYYWYYYSGFYQQEI